MHVVLLQAHTFAVDGWLKNGGWVLKEFNGEVIGVAQCGKKRSVGVGIFLVVGGGGWWLVTIHGQKNGQPVFQCTDQNVAQPVWCTFCTSMKRFDRVAGCVAEYFLHFFVRIDVDGVNEWYLVFNVVHGVDDGGQLFRVTRNQIQSGV